MGVEQVRGKWKDRLLTIFLVTASLCAGAGVVFLLCRYAQYEAYSRKSEEEKEKRMADTEWSSAGNALSFDEPLPETIRVAILDQDFQHEYHAEVVISCEVCYEVSAAEDGARNTEEVQIQEASEQTAEGSAYGEAAGTAQNVTDLCRTYQPDEQLCLVAGQLLEGQILSVAGEDGAPLKLESLKRGDGMPQYLGKLCLIGTAEGILVVNELPLEEYLYRVVSSEMPASYPAEALRAQAVCARTYAVNCIRSEISGNPYFDLNDSVSYQVYNNYAATEASRDAVDATAGEILTLEEVQYYSTSCLTEHREDLDGEAAFAAFLAEEPEEEAQYGSPWLRWSVQIPVETVLDNLIKYGAYETEEKPEEAAGYESFDTEAAENGTMTTVSVASRRGDGQVQTLVITSGESVYRIEGEYRIRQILGDAQAEITLRDGGTCSGMQLLPSAFFTLEQEEKVLAIRGGGYGHGNGMSQCGAAEMASEGLDYREILEYYYGKAACETIPEKDSAADD